MNTRLVAWLNVSVLTLTMAVTFLPIQSRAIADDNAASATTTEDVVFMRDGRELHGKILNETRSLVIFDYSDPIVKTTTKMTLLKDDIIRIDRGVAVAAAPKPAENPNIPAPARTTTTTTTAQRTYGTSRVTGNVTSVPSFYIVPMRGQMGTDIRSDVYKDTIAEIRELKPDVVILDVDCSDTNTEMMYPDGYERPHIPAGLPAPSEKNEWGMLELDDYREMVRMFRDEIRDVPQYVWIHDSDGISAIVFMAWPNIYLTPNARLGSEDAYLNKTNALRWQDSDVRAKMVAAWMGIAKAFLEKGGYSLQLAEAMLDARAKLSGDWHGREMKWELDNDGAYAVDTSDKETTYFHAKAAEDFCVSKGTAETLDDLALLLGYREYRVVDGKQQEAIAKYVEDWRRAFKDTQNWWDDFMQHMSWANEDPVKWLGRAKLDLEKIIMAMSRYKAVEMRWTHDFGIGKQDLEIIVEQMKEQLQALKRGNRGAAPGGMPGSGGRGRGTRE